MNAPLDLKFFQSVSAPASTGESESDSLSRLYRRACLMRVISAGDFFTIRDLLELSGHDRDASGDERLALHALLICMFKTLNDGSLCLSLREDYLTAYMTGILVGDAPRIARLIIKQIGAWPLLIGSESEFKPLLYVHTRAGEFIYFQRYFFHERKLKQQLSERLAGNVITQPASNEIKHILSEVLTERPVMTPAGKALECTGNQKIALCLPLYNGFSIVSGGPGSGKTTIVVNILRCLVRLKIDPNSIRLAAPTGRAAYRLTESIRGALTSIKNPAAADVALRGLEARTIHRLLQYRPGKHEFTYTSENQLQADVLIIDEASMVDVCMMARLLEAVPATTRVILIGDRDQLPSVDAGAVLADLIPDRDKMLFSAAMSTTLNDLLQIAVPVHENEAPLRDHVVMLNVSHRMNEGLRTVVAELKEGVSNSALDPARAITVGKVVEIPSPSAERRAGPKRSKKSVEEYAAEIAWPAHNTSANPGGYGWIDLDLAGADRWPFILSAWARRQYLEKNPLRPDSYVNMVKAARKMALFQNTEYLAAPESTEILRHLFDCIRQAQILSLVRNGRFGCTGINRRLSQVLKPHFDEWARDEYFSGTPILITRNDYNMNLFNGDVGVLLKSGGALRAVFQRAVVDEHGTPRDGFAAYGLDALPPWESAFAVTVHKSQGSEYEQVLLVVPPEADAARDSDSENDPPPHRLHTREIVYTGLTRAKHLAILCGASKTIQTAIQRKIERQSGLSLW